ncbi:aldehyde dehydrogenase [Pseudonocardia ailaonensis]|uniref:Aldehyde dehydrogenase n=1 Tax=Pseudonocardia ailaonensis TaxID=367279 RepID=A0ABN2NGS2_9PSEU
MRKFLMTIGADRCPALADEWIETENPYTGEPWAVIPRGREADAYLAVEAAHEAGKGAWGRLTATERGRLLHRLAQLIRENSDTLVDLEVTDVGRRRTELEGGALEYIASYYEYYAGLADKVEGQVTPVDRPGMLHYTTYQPMGVVVCIVPWNGPLLLASTKIAPALAAGNTVVVKPSEFASTSILALAELFDEAGFPPGVLNVVTGYGNEVGSALTSHPLVRKVAFTGGNAGGAAVARSAAEGFRSVTLELGGKSPNIVFADADLDAALAGVSLGIFSTSGQSCMAGSRLLVHRSIADEFVDRLVASMRDATLGDPGEPTTDIGPISTRTQFAAVLEHLDVARREGATAVLGGARALPDGGEKGWFVQPTILTNVTNDMRIAREEIFGPVLVVIPFDTDDEAVAIANDTNFGLAAAIWTSSLARAVGIPPRLEAGTVWVNAYRVVSAMFPFGGMKDSGVGRENGTAAIKEYLETKSIIINATVRTR